MPIGLTIEFDRNSMFNAACVVEIIALGGPHFIDIERIFKFSLVLSN